MRSALVYQESRYAFDVIERNGSPFLANRRVFAMADNGKYANATRERLQG